MLPFEYERVKSSRVLSARSAPRVRTAAEVALEVVSVVMDEAPVGDATASAPVAAQPAGALPEANRTGSLNVSSTALREVYFADDTVGAMPSDTAMFERAASALDAPSRIAPEPEPGSLPTSPAEVLYRSSTPSGFVSSKSELRVSTRRFPEPVPDATLRPAASPPDTDHPCASAPEARLSLNVTSIVVGEVAFADEMAGACPSAKSCDSAVEVPSALSDPSFTCAAFICTEPIAPVPTGLGAVNESTCVAVVCPDIDDMVAVCPPTEALP